MQRTLASLRRAYETASAETLVPSSFYDRFNNGLIAFLKECLAHGIAELSSHNSLTVSDKLKGFKDLIVSDGTVIRLHDKLAKIFPGARARPNSSYISPQGSPAIQRALPSIPEKPLKSKPCAFEPGWKTTSFCLISDISSMSYLAGLEAMVATS
ncbi:hypothetical protein ABDB91_12940 [Desulfoscipio sp. XC116]|uniref:hypothetical protein n=1 Tax=Desulfoscipio sp. XC116 TaxID=3144975 RepID=UPI00325ADB36